jgi:hydroxymethylpyrimidine/phosphomethylpyrimidine kinase
MESSVGGRPCVLSVAGFDPSGGAGVLADCKTFEACGVYGFGVCSALTYQNDTEFKGLRWISADEIAAQLRPLASRFAVQWAKIGIIENLSVLSAVIKELQALWPSICIVWDPVGAASAGFTFHTDFDRSELVAVLEELALVTPNIPELSLLGGEGEPLQAAARLSSHVSVLLKGGHAAGQVVTDLLCVDGKVTGFSSTRIPHARKHGSGCVLSAAIVAELAKGSTLQEAVTRGREYIRAFLKSNPSELGFHSTSQSLAPSGVGGVA